MPGVNIYLDDETYKLYKKLKSLLAYINKKRKTRLSVSYLLSLYLRQLVEALESSDLEKAKDIKLELPSIEINIERVELKERPKIHGQATITAIVLWEQYKEWKRRYRQAINAVNRDMKYRALYRLKNDIILELKRHKTIPGELLSEISKLLAKVDVEIDNINVNYVFT